MDPPLHEFLPREVDEVDRLGERLELSVAEVEARIWALREENPMLGHRGCRLGLTYPEIYEMQVAALAEATPGGAPGPSSHGAVRGARR